MGQMESEMVLGSYCSNKTQLGIVFNFFIRNNYEIEQRKLELQRIFTGRKDKEL